MMKYILLGLFVVSWLVALFAAPSFIELPQLYRISIGVGGALVLAVLSYFVAKRE